MVHRREIDGREIVLGNQGDLWNNALTLYDHETGSIWSQPIGEAILGPLTGKTLELLPSTLTRWSDWKEEHPDSWALDAPTGTSEFALDELAVVVEIGESTAAFPIPEIRQVGVANAEVDGVPIAVTAAADADAWRAYFRALDDRTVELELIDDTLVEIGGDGRWRQLDGLGIDGTTENLDLFPASTSFPADYERFNPDGLEWQDGELVPLVPFFHRLKKTSARSHPRREQSGRLWRDPQPNC